MEGPLVDMVLLGLLVTFFGIQQRRRSQPYFRFWFAGWILIFFSFLFWEARSAVPLLAAHREALRTDTLYLGGLAFLLSFVVRPNKSVRTALLGLIVAAPACVLNWLACADSLHFIALSITVFTLQAAFIHLTVDLLPRAWKERRAALTAFCASCGVAMITLAYVARPEEIMQVALAQVFIVCAILFAGTGNGKGLDWVIGILGFLGWGVAFLFENLLHPQLLAHGTLFQLWNLPKYAVGFAMTLRIFEAARDDVEGLADRYKDLYEDFRLLYENHPLPMWIVDAATGHFLSANAAACNGYGYSQEEFLSLTAGEVHQAEPVDTKPRLAIEGVRESEQAAQADPEAQSEASAAPRMQHRLKDGTLIAVEVTEHEILFQGREARFVMAVDVTQREKLNDELFHRAQHDTLTGLPNRALLNDRLEQALLRSARDRKKAVLFTMDVDRFKLINDTHGHLIGDECLKAIAERLKVRIRSVDTIARTGGEEFTAIIGGLNTAEDADKIASMFLRLFDSPLRLPDQELKLSMSIGAAIYPDDGEDAETLRRKSDQALYHAKRLGRNRFAVASREVCATFDRAMAVEIALRDALRNGGFELYFQPVYNMDGCASHFEALLRMRPGAQPIFEPSVFIPIAEECGLIVPIGNWVVETACEALVEWRRLGGDQITVAINVSGKQLVQREFGAFVLDTLEEHGLPPSALELELTETSLMAEPVIIRDAMEELAREGIRFSIDDFGTGYSSLARIADLPISLLKIDRSFIAQLDTAQRTDGIVAAIIHMAQTLNVAIVAEGVENASQLNHLLRRGCDLYQGYFLSKPISTADLAEALATHSPILFAHPNFSHTRVAVSKRVRLTNQLPAFAAGTKGAA